MACLSKEDADTVRTFKDGAEADGEGQSIQISGSENQHSNVAN